MIPKKIHYCWFGRGEKPKLAKKCIASWKKYCPDYEIIEWNEDNFDISACPLYVRQAYEAKKWAFVTDYVRLQVVYEHGGIYMDTDVELKKSLDPLLEYNAYFGFEDETHIATGLGFGAVKGTPILMEMMEDYQDIPFIQPDGSFDTTACPARNTHVLVRYGLVQNNHKQLLWGNVLVLPTISLCPVSFNTGEHIHSKESYSIHWFSASWQTQEQRKRYTLYMEEMRKIRFRGKVNDLLHFPHRIILKMLGENNYIKLKSFLGKG